MGFIAHAIKHSDAFHIVDNGPPGRAKFSPAINTDRSKANNNCADHKKDQTVPRVARQTLENTPMCVWPPHRAK